MPEASTALQTWAVLAVFLLVYLGMFLGGLPRLQLDRSGVAVLGAIAAIALTGMPLEEAARSIDLPTLVLLFAFMLISAQLRLGGFYSATTRWVGRQPLSERGLLAALIATAGVLSAVFSNDVICLAMTPVVVQLCLDRRLPPVPYLLGLACAANIGSAATLIGNPQNMLIGSVLQLPFAGYASAALLPVGLSLLWLWVWLGWGVGWVVGRGNGGGKTLPAATPYPTHADPAPAFDHWQSAKGLAVAAALLAVFLITDWPPAPAALVGAGLLLLSRRVASSRVMGLIDWPLLLLFIGLFVVNHAMAWAGWPERAVAALASMGVLLSEPFTLLVGSAVLSNAVSNVPAVMLLLPHVQDSPAVQQLGTVLALASTFAGNLLLVGSIANLIVVDLARRQGVHIDWRVHLRTGVPVTLGSLLVVAVLVAWPARAQAQPRYAPDLQPFTGKVVRVADGDSLTVLDASQQQHRIRLAGIDAPERQQPFSQRSREHLSSLVAGQTVRVEPSKLDRYQRMVAKVFVQGQDASLAQLQAGLAWHYKEYEREQPREDRLAYAEAEDAARAARRGLWQDRQPLAPWDFRRQARAQQGQNR